MVIDAIKRALEKMDKRYCMLSTIDYHKLDESFREKSNISPNPAKLNPVCPQMTSKLVSLSK